MYLGTKRSRSIAGDLVLDRQSFYLVGAPTLSLPLIIPNRNLYWSRQLESAIFKDPEDSPTVRSIPLLRTHI